MLLAVAGSIVALDQGSKHWAITALKHSCETLERTGPRRLRVARCHNRELTVDLGGERARQLSFRRGTRTFYALRCRDDIACLSGPVPLGSAPSAAEVIRPRRDPVEQALLLFREAPLETSTLTSGPDGQLYLVEAVGGDGRRSTLRFRYRSPGRVIRVIAGLFDLRYVENPGAAWGLLANVDENVRRPFFLAVSVIAILFILWVYWRLGDGQRLLATALALVLGGAVGNLIDRLRFGQVVDFIDWHYHDRLRWPTFNVADAAITIGVLLLLVEGVRSWRRERRARRAGSDASA